MSEEKKYEYEEVIAVCTCSHLSHVVRFSRNENGEVRAEVSLDYERSFWTRLQVAWRYLLRDVCAYGDVSEVELTQKDLKKIQGWAE